MPNMEKTWLVKANGVEFTFSQEEIEALDLIQKSPDSFNLINNHRSVNAIIKDDPHNRKKINVELEGEIVEILIKDELDQMLDQMGFSTASTRQIKEIKAPMPGLVLAISVENGQEVKEGEKLLILEAMKMENSIMIHTNAIIKKIVVTAGQAVEKGQVLVELE